MSISFVIKRMGDFIFSAPYKSISFFVTPIFYLFEKSIKTWRIVWLFITLKYDMINEKMAKILFLHISRLWKIICLSNYTWMVSSSWFVNTLLSFYWEYLCGRPDPSCFAWPCLAEGSTIAVSINLPWLIVRCDLAKGIRYDAIDFENENHCESQICLDEIYTWNSMKHNNNRK